MADVVDDATRSRMMAGIRAANTRPELLLRKALFRLGLRYRLHGRGLPGKPDLVFPRWQAVVFVHGCFWHLHGCELFRWPATRREFWRKKLEGNRARDRRNTDSLLAAGWRVLTVWECAFKRKGDAPLRRTAQLAAAWLRKEKGVPADCLPCASIAPVNGQPAMLPEIPGISGEAAQRPVEQVLIGGA